MLVRSVLFRTKEIRSFTSHFNMPSTALLTALLLSCQAYLVTAKVTVTWNGTTVAEGFRLRVPVRVASSGGSEIRENITCSAFSTVEKLEFSCTLEGNTYTRSVNWQRETFPFSSTEIVKWYNCRCTAYYSSDQTESSTFLMSSKADIKKRIVEMLITLLGSISSTVILTQFIGHRSLV